MIIIKNLFRIILILILFTIIAQSKESNKIIRNEWVISLEQYFLNLGNIEGSFTQIDEIGNITENEIILDKEPILHIDDLIKSNKNWLEEFMEN